MPKANTLIISQKPIYCGIHEYSEPGPSLLDLHYEMEAGIVYSGIMQRQYKNVSADLKAGQVWVCNMLEPHSCHIIKVPCKVAVFLFRPEVLAGISAAAKPAFDAFSLFWESPIRRPQADEHGIKELMGIVKSMQRFQNMDEGRKILWVQALLIQTLLLAQENWQIKGPSPSFESYGRISQGIHRISQNPGRFISVQEASKACAMSRNTFSSLFRKTMGISFPKFAQSFRIRQAAMELLQTNRSSKQIADSWGFTDVSHFHRCFIKHYGCTPKQYRLQSKSRGLPE